MKKSLLPIMSLILQVVCLPHILHLHLNLMTIRNMTNHALDSIKVKLTHVFEEIDNFGRYEINATLSQFEELHVSARREIAKLDDSCTEPAYTKMESLSNGSSIEFGNCIRNRTGLARRFYHRSIESLNNFYGDVLGIVGEFRSCETEQCHIRLVKNAVREMVKVNNAIHSVLGATVDLLLSAQPEIEECSYKHFSVTKRKFADIIKFAINCNNKM